MIVIIQRNGCLGKEWHHSILFMTVKRIKKRSDKFAIVNQNIKINQGASSQDKSQYQGLRHI